MSSSSSASRRLRISIALSSRRCSSATPSCGGHDAKSGASSANSPVASESKAAIRARMPLTRPQPAPHRGAAWRARRHWRATGARCRRACLRRPRVFCDTSRPSHFPVGKCGSVLVGLSPLGTGEGVCYAEVALQLRSLRSRGGGAAARVRSQSAISRGVPGATPVRKRLAISRSASPTPPRSSLPRRRHRSVAARLRSMLVIGSATLPRSRPSPASAAAPRSTARGPGAGSHTAARLAAGAPSRR
jgi:hypothetical protein